MIFIHLPAMLCVLPIVILIEALIYIKLLRLHFKSAFQAAISSNLISTLVGLPLAWLVSLLIELLLIPLSFAGEHFGWHFEAPAFQIFTFFLSVGWLPPLTDSTKWLLA